MGIKTNKPFDVKLIKENQYYRLYVTHPNFKGRIRKRLGDRSYEDLENIMFSIKYELGKQFISGEIIKSEVESFIDNYIGMNVKQTASVFDYKEDFLKSKEETLNKKTRRTISYSTLSGYRTALKYFENFLINKGHSSHPTQINKKILDSYYNYISGSHNYKTKLHTKLKGFIIFLEKDKQLQIDPSYKLSSFTEEYDNQCPEDDDIALTEDEVKKLIELREKFLKGEVEIEKFKKSDKIPIELQERQFNMKKENIIKCLDCFLFMISTGMYYADIIKTTINFNGRNGLQHISYRRAKNGSLCKAIPIKEDNIFISKQIVDQYGIKNGSNFPLNLSLTHFDKHLGRISSLANIGFKITNKMARKTFASYLYFNKNLPIHYLQILLGHKDVKDTAHYLRISDEDIANEVMRWTSNTPNK